ncbi:aminoglycoside phosphotransferase [Cordyceps militaris]|uniref:Aminoglycoside phosphotransferase n=1 Tax=Cordyceps militaris TaxID=73501 RepID=A0A2H4SHK5_CORMI|nr:aminoglycoside phosphotransferase [Cordyceps militaris]
MQQDAPHQIYWTASNYERHYQLGETWFVKRQLSDEELPVDKHGQTIRPLWDTERLRNEFTATTGWTDAFCLEAHLRRDSAGKRPAGTRIAAVAAVAAQMTRFILPQLQGTRRRYIGSLGQFIPVLPPRRIYNRDSREWEQWWAHGDVFVYCHNNLSAKNIWIHPEHFKIMAAMHRSVLTRDLSFFDLEPSDLRDCVPVPHTR